MTDKLNWKEKLEITIEAGLQLVPTVGGSLASLYFGTKQEKRFKRIESFYQELAQQMEQQRIMPLSIENHDADALTHLIEKLNDSIEQEHLDQKRQCFKLFLIHSLSTPTTNNNFDERSSFLSCLSNMSLLDMSVLRYLKNEHDPTRVRYIQIPQVDIYSVVGSIGKISSYGYLKTYNVDGSVGFSDVVLNQMIELSDLGKKFIDYCLA